MLPILPSFGSLVLTTMHKVSRLKSYGSASWMLRFSQEKLGSPLQLEDSTRHNILLPT